MCYNVKIMVIVAGILLLTGKTAYAEEAAQPSETETIKKNAAKLKKSITALESEMKKVKSSVSDARKGLQELKSLPQALAEMNLKLEAQSATVTALSGEVYRLGSQLENKMDKGGPNRIELEQVQKRMTDYSQAVQDLKNEIKILREMQADIQSRTAAPSASEGGSEKWKRVLQWKYWGQAACGVALIALIVAL